MSTERTTPQQADWHAEAIIGREIDGGTETNVVDAYFTGDKPGWADLFTPADGWHIIEFRARRAGR